jgi:Rod binding domain-containing protein
MRIQPREGLDTQRWQLREVTRQMEAQFLHQLLRAMRRTIPTTQCSYTIQMYTDMMDESLAQQLAQSDQFGLAKLLYQKLSPYLQAPERVSGGAQNEQTG